MRLIACLLLTCLAGCGEQQRTGQDGGGQSRDRSPGWHAPSRCHWERFGNRRDLEAWIVDDRDFYGTVLVVMTPLANGLPVSNNLDLAILPDGDPSRAVAARGFHGDGDAADWIGLEFRPAQRAKLAEAGRVDIVRGGQTVASVPMKGAPREADIAPCDPPADPKPYPDDWADDPR